MTQPTLIEQPGKLQMQHTPGPWQADEKPQWYPWPEAIEIKAGNWTIAWTTTSAEFRDRTVADARLIAAAPDMLAALKAFQHAWVFVEVYDGAYAKAVAAIAKATGK